MSSNESTDTNKNEQQKNFTNTKEGSKDIKPIDQFFNNFKRFMNYDREGKQNMPASAIAQDVLARSYRDKRLEKNNYNNDINTPLQEQNYSGSNSPQQKESEAGSKSPQPLSSLNQNNESYMSFMTIIGILVAVNIGFTVYILYRVYQYEKLLIYQNQKIEESFIQKNKTRTEGLSKASQLTQEERKTLQKLIQHTTSQIAKEYNMSIEDVLQEYSHEIFIRMQEKLQKA